MRTPDELTEMFRARGLKVTPQRQCIFRLLHGNDVHPTADTVYAQARAEMPTISLKTVYQTLNDLSEMGELQLLDLGTGAARFDPNVDAHHHLVCEGCGKVRDLYADFPEVKVPRGRDQGFRVRGAEVVFRGLCDQCQASTKSAAGIDNNRRKAHARSQGQQDRRELEGGVRGRKPSQPPLPLLRPEG